MITKIGIVGSAFKLTKKEIKIARRLGKEIVKNKSLQSFICFDKKSLPMEVGKDILKASGKITCFCSNIKEETAAKKIGFSTSNLNSPRLSREITFIKNVDGIIVCGGGSGTLMEVTFAYQLNKPIFLLKGIRGSVDVFSGKFMDKRKKVRIKTIDLKNVGNMQYDRNLF